MAPNRCHAILKYLHKREVCQKGASVFTIVKTHTAQLCIIKLRAKIHCITIFSICKQIFIKKEKDLLYRSFNTFAFYHKNGGSKPPPYGLARSGAELRGGREAVVARGSAALCDRKQALCVLGGYGCLLQRRRGTTKWWMRRAGLCCAMGVLLIRRAVARHLLRWRRQELP